MENTPRKREKSIKKITSDPVADVINKYTSNGWSIIVPSKGGLNDIIAQKDRKLHFTQVVTQDSISDAKHQGIAKNTFIQNAFSNGAQPIYAHVTYGSKCGANGAPSVRGVTFEDVNSESRVIIASKKTIQPDSTDTVQSPDQ